MNETSKKVDAIKKDSEELARQLKDENKTADELIMTYKTTNKLLQNTIEKEGVNEEYIFVCDTDNNRIVLFDLQGKFIKIIPQPVSSYFEEGDIYKPIACVADDYGRLFVVSSTTYQGIIVIDMDGNFFGFIGATKVVVSPIELLWRRFQTKEQRARMQDYVPTEFNNISIDDQNFIYVTTSSIEIDLKSNSSDGAPVRKLNASGADVMARNGFFPPSGEIAFFEDLYVTDGSEITGPSKIVDVAIGPEGTWSIVDEKRSTLA